MADMKKYDFNRNKTERRIHAGSGMLYTYKDEHSRVTSSMTFSRWIGDKLYLTENTLDRTYFQYWGVQPRVLLTNKKTGVQTLSTTLGLGPGTPLNDAYIQRLADNKAVALFTKRVEERIILGMEYINERKSFWRVMRSFATKLWEIFQACKQRKFKSLRKFLPREKRWSTKRVEMTFHEKWLGFHFALKPIMDDIFNYLHKETMRDGAFGRVRVKGSEMQKAYVNGSLSAGDYSCLYESSCRTTYVAQVDIASAVSAAANYVGLDPSKFIWDILPFSFVVDWFFNVGAWLDALARPGYSIKSCSTTRTKRNVWDETAVCTYKDTADISYSTFGSGLRRQRCYIQRTHHQPRITLAWAGGIDSGWRAITSMALLRSVFSKGK